MRGARRFFAAGMLAATLGAGCPASFGAAAPPPFLAVVGDSLSVGLADALRELRPGAPVVSLGVVSSGLGNPRFVDWQARIRQVAEARPTIVLVMIGMNDSAESPTRDYVYAVLSFLKPLRTAGIPFALVGVPQTDDPARNRNIVRLNTVYEKLAPVLGGRFVPIAPFERGERTRDGIHFTRDGYRDLARRVLVGLHAGFGD